MQYTRLDLVEVRALTCKMNLNGNLSLKKSISVYKISFNQVGQSVGGFE